MSWLDDIQTAFVNLGGVAGYQDLYAEIGRVRGKKLTPTNEATVRKEIERCSSSSKNWEERVDLFYTVEGLGKGIWGLRAAERKPLPANDLVDDLSLPEGQEAPKRQRSAVFRIIRDTKVSQTIKQLHSDKCQLCDTVIVLADGTTYSEAHHIKPLGMPHNGPDKPENIIVACPNCHAMLDYFSIPINLAEIRKHSYHRISNEYVEYHNTMRGERYGKNVDSDVQPGSVEM